MLTKIASLWRDTTRRFLWTTNAAIAISFAFAVPAIVASAGITVDLAQAYNVKTRLGNALDKAALAAASSAGDAEEVEERVMRFIEANYNEDDLGATFGVEVEVGESTVTVRGYSRVDTTFMKIMSIDYIDVFEEVIVAREVRGLEVAMVLDNTGSMDYNNNIGTLRTASENFVNILFDAAADPEDIKIGMVPYSSSVRVGRYGLGLNPDGTTYGDGTVFVTLPSGVSYTTNKSSSTGWYGCIVEHRSTNYNAAATHVTNSSGQLWRTAASCSNNTNCRGHGWDPSSGSNNPYPNDIPDAYQGPWDIYMYGTLTRNCSSGSTCNPKWTYNRDSRPNRYCPYASILPLTSSREALIANIATMASEGATLPNVGMAWGYRLLSPDPPFEEGVAWDDEDWRKAVIMMTDGETSMGGNYTAYWFTSHNDIANDDLNDRMLEICEDLKANDVIIYTVTFASENPIPEETKDAYRTCATSTEHYFDAPTQQDLVDTFEEIARQLANLHIVK